MTIEHLLAWNTAWILLWGLMTLGGVILLFFGTGNGIYRAMRIHGTFVTAFLFLTAVTQAVNVVINPDARYILAVLRAVLTPLAAVSVIYIGFELWKVRGK
ncbi:MAG: hypothetical protein BroJett011_62640 [Chloroflexota bacterium]|nr:MAG: hypothetical protein BroJett011_62640 [Chloroflexota bacterium]